jgi:hypothetical protein
MIAADVKTGTGRVFAPVHAVIAPQICQKAY